MIIGINALTHTAQTAPTFLLSLSLTAQTAPTFLLSLSLTAQTAPTFLLSLSLTAQTAPTFFTLIQTQTHSSSEKDTNRSCSLFSLNVQSNSFIFYQQINHKYNISFNKCKIIIQHHK